MTNTSIRAAFERMWQHVVTKLSDKSDKNHTHDGYVVSEELDELVSGFDTALGNIVNGTTPVAEATHSSTADSATNATKATQDGGGNVITSTYETKVDATTKFDNAKAYVDAELAKISTSAQVQTDYNQNDETAVDYIKNRPFYEEEMEELFYGDVAVGLAPNGSGMAYGELLTSSPFTKSELVHIAIGDEMYEFMSVDEIVIDNNPAGFMVGNKYLYLKFMSVLEGVSIEELLNGIPEEMASLFANDTGESFVILDQLSGSQTLILNSVTPTTAGAETATVNVEIISSGVHQLDEKFIPSAIARKSDLKNSASIELYIWEEND